MSEDAPQLLTSEDIFSAQFPATKFRDGYDQNQIDDYLDEVVRVLSYYEALNASPEAEVDLAYITVRGRDVREVDFDYTRMRVGYDQDAVDDYLDQVAATLEAYEKLYGIPPSDQRYQVLQVDGAALEAEAAEQAAASGELSSSAMSTGEETVTPIELSPAQSAVETGAEDSVSTEAVPVTVLEPSEESEVRSSVLGTPTGSIPAVQPVSFEQAVFTNPEVDSPNNDTFGGDAPGVAPSFPPLNSQVSVSPQVPTAEADMSPAEGSDTQSSPDAALPPVEPPVEPVTQPHADGIPTEASPEMSDEWGEVPQYPVDAQMPEGTDATNAQPYSEAGYDPYQPYGYDAYGQPMTVNPAQAQGNAEQYPDYPTETGYVSPYGMATPEGYDYVPQAEGESQTYIPDDTTMVMPLTGSEPWAELSDQEAPSEYAPNYAQPGYPHEYGASPTEAVTDFDSSYETDQEQSYDLEESLDDDYPDEISLDDSPDLPSETTDNQALQADFYAPSVPEEASASPILPAGGYSPEIQPGFAAPDPADYAQVPDASPELSATMPVPHEMSAQPESTTNQFATQQTPPANDFALNEWGADTPQPSPYQPAAPDFSTNQPAYPVSTPEPPAQSPAEQLQSQSDLSTAPSAYPTEPSPTTFQMPSLETPEMRPGEAEHLQLDEAETAHVNDTLPGEAPKAPLTDVVAPPLPTPGVGLDLGQIHDKLEQVQAATPVQSEPKLADLPGVLMTPTRTVAPTPPPETASEALATESTTEPSLSHPSTSSLEALAAQNTASIPDEAPDVPMVDTQSADGTTAQGQPAPLFPEDSNPRPMLQGEEPLAEVDPDGRFVPHFLAGYRSNLDTFTSVYGALDESGLRAKPASITKLEAQQPRKSITTGYLVTVATSRPLGADDQVFVRLPDGREVPVTSASSDFDGVHLTIPHV